MRIFLFFGLPFLFVGGGRAFAYPQYAVRHNVQSCTACHFSPVGGGPRNLNGKLYGAGPYRLNPFLKQDYVGADFRALYYYPQRPTDAKGGAGIMVASVWGHAAVDEAERIHLVLEHNIGGFSQAPYRDTYVLFNLYPNNSGSHAFDTLLIGRFRAPFGIMTDEHRTYTRIQTATEFFTFETGALLSGNPGERWHYDVGLSNGDKNNGGGLTSGNAERYGGLINVRYMPGAVLVGASGEWFDRDPRRTSRQAGSLYSILSIGRMTNERIPLSIRIEHARAQNWNDHLGRGFLNDPAYVTSIKTSQSHGWLAFLEYDISAKLKAIYKYDRLTPDRDYPTDTTDRHGFGLEYQIGPNVWIRARTEFARSNIPAEKGSIAEDGQDATWTFLHLEI